MIHGQAGSQRIFPPSRRRPSVAWNRTVSEIRLKVAGVTAMGRRGSSVLRRNSAAETTHAQKTRRKTTSRTIIWQVLRPSPGTPAASLGEAKRRGGGTGG